MGRAPAFLLSAPHLPRREYARLARILAVSTLLAALGAGVVAARPDMLRSLFAAALTLLLMVLCFARPRVGVLATLSFLPFLALLRRLLIEDAGWPSTDPLVLIGPIVVITLVVRMFVLEGRPLAPDRLSKLVLVLAVLATFQVFNPGGPGLTAALAGLMFFLGPLLWFFVGRELADDALVRALLVMVVVSAALVAIYGIYQAQVGLPSWDRLWADVATQNYESLNVGDQLRPWGTFSSSAEYALWLGAALTVAIAMTMHRAAYLLVAVPVIGAGVFLAGTRSALLGALLGVVVLIGLRTRRGGASLAVVLVGVVGMVGFLTAVGPQLQRAAGQTGNDLVERQVGGVTDPFNENQSTLTLHYELFKQGVSDGFRQPLGTGTGSTGRALGKFGGGSNGEEAKATTEVDVSDTFRSFGPLGGLTYLALIVGIGVAVLRAYGRGHVLALAIAGLLIVTFGQWLTGGHYALAPLTWLLIGWLAARANSQTESEPEEAPVALGVGRRQGPGAAASGA